MSGSDLANIGGSYLSPAYEHAQVSDAMRAGVLSCPPDTSLRTVARMMATYHVHSIVVTGIEPGTGGAPEEHAWGVVSDLDLAKAADSLDDLSAGGVAATEVVTVEGDTPLTRAVQLMAEHETAHLVVVDRPGGRPIGMLSTLDLAGVLAWNQA